MDELNFPDGCGFVFPYGDLPLFSVSRGDVVFRVQTRNVNQVELSLTDARTLGIAVPVRESGDVKGSTAITIKGPCGEVALTEGAIAAKRHIHMTPADAERFNVKNGDIVNVKVVNETGRGLIFGDTVIRVSDKYALAMHIDTDEANAGALSGLVKGIIVK